jgi:hypothetical protein
LFQAADAIADDRLNREIRARPDRQPSVDFEGLANQARMPQPQRHRALGRGKFASGDDSVTVIQKIEAI